MWHVLVRAWPVASPYVPYLKSKRCLLGISDLLKDRNRYSQQPHGLLHREERLSSSADTNSNSLRLPTAPAIVRLREISSKSANFTTFTVHGDLEMHRWSVATGIILRPCDFESRLRKQDDVRESLHILVREDVAGVASFQIPKGAEAGQNCRRAHVSSWQLKLAIQERTQCRRAEHCRGLWIRSGFDGLLELLAYRVRELFNAGCRTRHRAPFRIPRKKGVE